MPTDYFGIRFATTLRLKRPGYQLADTKVLRTNYSFTKYMLREQNNIVIPTEEEDFIITASTLVELVLYSLLPLWESHGLETCSLIFNSNSTL